MSHQFWYVPESGTTDRIVIQNYNLPSIARTASLMVFFVRYRSVAVMLLYGFVNLLLDCLTS